MNPAEVVENIRKRVPFKLASDDLDEDSNQILDEQGTRVHLLAHLCATPPSPR